MPAPPKAAVPKGTAPKSVADPDADLRRRVLQNCLKSFRTTKDSSRRELLDKYCTVDLIKELIKEDVCSQTTSVA